ncbi:MAG: transcriptional regulator [Chloroflexi bacterium SZAS-1]|nr:transcriptional regulator [Chloroflexi bacterium SZAS-1]
MSLRFQQKLIIPADGRPLIERLQLRTELEQAITTRRVVALAAPAGWGKTTALAQWAAISSLPVAWYTLDPGDRDPKLFLDYLLHSIADFVDGAAELLARLVVSDPQGLPEIFHATALAISAGRIPFALVLDDFHVFDDAPPGGLPGTNLIFDLLASVAQYATKCHIVLVSRTLPALRGLVRMVAQQRAAVFDYTALQFSAAEIQQLAGQAYALTLSDAHAEQLVVRLDGWITGIVLSLDRSGMPGDAPARNTDAAPALPAMPIEMDTSQVYAFFAEQIIAPLPPALQHFLEETSVLEDLSPQRCEALRRRGDAATLFDEVKRYGLFVSSRAGWLSYHSLFREFLRLRLARDPQRERHFLLQAAELYREEDDLPRAIDCYRAANAPERAFDLLRITIPRFRQRSRQMTLLACFERFQPQAADALVQCEEAQLARSVSTSSISLPPDLLLAQARVYSDLALWERAYLAIELVETIGDYTTRWEARMLRADLLNLQGDDARPSLADVPYATLPAHLQLEFHIIHGRAQILSRDLMGAVLSLEQARALAPLDEPATLADIHDNLGWAYATQGNRTMALRHLKQADACWQASGNYGRRALTLSNLGALATDEGRYEEGREALEAGLALARQTARRREETLLRCNLADIDVLEGDLDQALARFTEVHTLAMRMDVSSSVAAAAAGALWVAALQGDSAVAQAWLDIASSLEATGQPEVRGRMALAHALLCMQQKRPSLAQVAELAAAAAEEEGALSWPEQAYLVLLQTALQFAQGGWAAAAAGWPLFTARAARLSEALVIRLVRPHHTLLAAAAALDEYAARFHDLLRLASPTRWRITALGSFACLVDGEECELSSLHRALLVRLLDAGPAGLTVERLWEAVWGESELSMPALHQALRRLRVQTGLAVAARDGHCAIRSNWDAMDYDVRRFEVALEPPLEREAAKAAITLYQGEFLPGAPLSAALWVDARRAHLRERYLVALEQLAHAVEREAPQLAIHYYQQVLQVDGCREQTAAQLMQLAARFGNRSLVNATFEHLKGALRTLGAAPLPATAALYQQLH